MPWLAKAYNLLLFRLIGGSLFGCKPVGLQPRSPPGRERFYKYTSGIALRHTCPSPDFLCPHELEAKPAGCAAPSCVGFNDDASPVVSAALLSSFSLLLLPSNNARQKKKAVIEVFQELSAEITSEEGSKVLGEVLARKYRAAG